MSMRNVSENKIFCKSAEKGRIDVRKKNIA